MFLLSPADNSPKELFLSMLITLNQTTSEENGCQELLPIRTPRSFRNQDLSLFVTQDLTTKPSEKQAT